MFACEHVHVLCVSILLLLYVAAAYTYYTSLCQDVAHKRKGK